MASPEANLMEQGVRIAQENWEIIFASLLVAAFTFKQREWFKRRDTECLLKGKDGIICSNPQYDEIDHLTPQGISKERIGLTEEQTDTPLNGGRLCQNHHRGHPNSKHPDAHVALYDYREGDKESFRKLRPQRNAKIQSGEEYWNDNEGDYLAGKIRKKTIRYVLDHPNDPFPKKDNGKR